MKSAFMDKRRITAILSLMKLKKLLPGLVLALLIPSAAWAGTQTMVYEVYAGGIHALTATLNIKNDQNRYDIVLDAKTYGFLAKLVPWEGRFESHGWIEKDGWFKPELHKSTATWKDESEIKEYKYTRKDGFVSLFEINNGKEPERKTIEKELTEGTTDALTATLNVLNGIAVGKECNGAEDVFDGKRRFTEIFKDHGVTMLLPSKYNIFEGDATECTVEITPVAGEWHKKPRGWLSIQEQGREQGTMPTMWAGALSKGNPAVPVKIRIKTSYGVLFMHLAEYKDGDRSLVAEKRHKE